MFVASFACVLQCYLKRWRRYDSCLAWMRECVVLDLLFEELIFLSHTLFPSWRTDIDLDFPETLSLSLSLSLSSLSPQAALFVLLSTASVSLKHSSHTTKTGWVVPTARLREQTNTYTIKVCVKKGTRQHGRLILRERGTESESEGGREKIKGGKTHTQTHKGWKNNSGTTNAVCGTFCCTHTPTQKKKGQGDKFNSTLLAGNVGNLDCKRAATVCTSTEKEHLLQDCWNRNREACFLGS